MDLEHSLADLILLTDPLAFYRTFVHWNETECHHSRGAFMVILLCHCALSTKIACSEKLKESEAPTPPQPMEGFTQRSSQGRGKWKIGPHGQAGPRAYAQRPWRATLSAPHQCPFGRIKRKTKKQTLKKQKDLYSAVCNTYDY